MSSANETFAAPYAALTPTDHGGQLLIVNICGFFVAFCSVALRINISRRETKNGFAFYKDDLLCFTAFVCQLQLSRFQPHTNPPFQAVLHHSVCPGMDWRNQGERPIHILDLVTTSYSNSGGMQCLTHTSQTVFAESNPRYNTPLISFTSSSSSALEPAFYFFSNDYKALARNHFGHRPSYFYRYGLSHLCLSWL
jgi:hypothetical protein